MFHRDRFDGQTLSRSTFEPRDRKSRQPDVRGISLYRETCLTDRSLILTLLRPEQQLLHGIARIPVFRVLELGLIVQSDPIYELPGHVVIPELHSDSKKDPRYKIWLRKLADLSGCEIVHHPQS